MVPTPEDSEEEHTAESVSKKKDAKGRTGNTFFPFDKDHPLHGIYVQRIRSKLVCPILAGAPPPKPPVWTSNNKPSKTWKDTASTYACYFLTLFKPWDSKNGFDHPPTWKHFGEFINHLERPMVDGTPSFIARSTMRIIMNVSNNLRINHTLRDAFSQYRGREATVWNEKKPDWSEVCDAQANDEHSGERAKGNNPDDKAVAEAIAKLRDASRADDPFIQDQTTINQAKYAAYNNNTLAALKNIIPEL